MHASSVRGVWCMPRGMSCGTHKVAFTNPSPSGSSTCAQNWCFNVCCMVNPTHCLSVCKHAPSDIVVQGSAAVRCSRHGR
jgi:hypothetical protein